MVQYGPDEARTTTRNAWLASTGLLYDSAQLYAALSYEHHHDFFGGSRNVPGTLSNASNARRALERLVVARNAAVPLEQPHRRGQRRLHALRGDRRREWPLPRPAALVRRALARLEVERRVAHRRLGGRLRQRLVLAVRRVPCRTDGLDGRQLSLGAAYYLSRRTSVFALYAKLWNGRSAQYNNVDGIDMPVGADPQQLAVGSCTASDRTPSMFVASPPPPRSPRRCSCAGAASAQPTGIALANYAGADRMQKFIEGAKKEGELTIYTSAQVDDMGALVAAFEKKYGVKVNVWRSAREKVLQRAVTEARGNRHDADVARDQRPGAGGAATARRSSSR